MPHYPWFDEQADLLGGYPSYEAHYRHVCHTVLTNESKYAKTAVDEINFDKDGSPKHLWNSIVPSTEKHSIAESSEQLREASQQDLQDYQHILLQSSLHVRFESSANRPEMPPEQYRQYMRELNDEQ